MFYKLKKKIRIHYRNLRVRFAVWLLRKGMSDAAFLSVPDAPFKPRGILFEPNTGRVLTMREWSDGINRKWELHEADFTQERKAGALIDYLQCEVNPTLKKDRPEDRIYKTMKEAKNVVGN